MNDYGEYDKRLVILTKEAGKITAFAHGARRPNSQMASAANSFVMGEFDLYQSRLWHIHLRVPILKIIFELSQDMEKHAMQLISASWLHISALKVRPQENFSTFCMLPRSCLPAAELTLS